MPEKSIDIALSDPSVKLIILPVRNKTARIVVNKRNND